MESVSEVWRDIKGYEGKYQVSNLGNVRSLDRMVKHPQGGVVPRKSAPLKQNRHSGGYLVVGLCQDPKRYVHRLVMQAFVGEPPAGMNDVNHIDGDKTNNCLSNLEYCNRLHNVRHAIRTGLQDNTGANNGGVKYTFEQIKRAYDIVAAGGRTIDAARETGLPAGYISLFCGRGGWGLQPLPKRKRKLVPS